MIKAIIFDIFGVLTIDGWLKFCDAHFKDSSRRQKAQELNRQTDIGKLDYGEFLQKISEMTGKPTEEINSQLYERLPKNEQLLKFTRDKLKPHYKIGILSNISSQKWVREYFAPDELELFDDIVLSVQVGIIKPSAKIFEIAAQRLGVGLDDCVFVDDRLKNVEAAQELGMKAIFYQNFPDFRKELSKYLNTGSEN